MRDSLQVALVVKKKKPRLPIQETWETRVSSMGPEDILEKGNGSPLQYSCLGNSMDRGARQATVHEVAKSQTHAQGRQECLKPLQVVALSVP